MNTKMAGGTFATNTGLLTATGAETFFDTTVAIDYCVKGRAGRKAATTDGASPTTDANTGDAFTALAASQGCWFVWCLQLDGTVKVAQGEIRNLVADGTNDNDADFEHDNAIPPYPTVPADCCPFAIQLVKNAEDGSAWIFGTDDWNQTGLNDLIEDILTMPDRIIDLTTA